MLTSGLGKRFLCTVDRPLRCEVAAVLAGVRVADHDLDLPAVPQEPLVSEQLVEDPRRRGEIVERLEQRHDRGVWSGQLERTQHVVGRRRVGDDDGVARRGERRARGLLRKLARVHADVEFRDVEAEDLDRTLQLGDACRQPRAAMLLEAAADHGEVLEQRVRRLVRVVREPPPDERELAPVGLELVLRADLRRIVWELPLVACERLLELVRHFNERAVR